MAQHEQQAYEPAFQLGDTYVVKGWEEVNPNGEKTSVSIQKVEVFLNYVFEKSKDEFEMEIGEDADYMQMILDFLDRHKINRKKTFTLEEALEILNWAVEIDDQGDEQQQEQNQEQQQYKNQVQGKSKPKKQGLQSIVNQNKQIHSENPLKNEERQQNQNEKPNKVTQVYKVEEQKQQKKQYVQQHNQSKHQQRPQILIQKNEPENKHQHTKYQHQQSKQHDQDENDWGKNDNHQEMNKKLYNEISSYQQKYPNKNTPLNNIFMNQESFNQSQQFHNDNDNLSPAQTSKKYYKQPLSIKKSLAQLKKPKVHKQSKDIPLLKLEPSAKQMKYLKRQKIILKNKKPNPVYHPQLTGIQGLFKFYCGLNSEFYSISMHKDPAKGTFDEFQSRTTNLYMHNFMLLCKDFNISESKINAKAGLKNMLKDSVIQNMTETKSIEAKTEIPVNRRSSKGLAPQSIQVSPQMNNNRAQVEIEQKKKKQPKGKGQKAEGQKEIWDRDKLSNYFKRQADYTLNIKYYKFIQIIKTVLNNKLVIQSQEKPQKKTQHQHVPQKQYPKKEIQAKIQSSQDDKQYEVSQGQTIQMEKDDKNDQLEPKKEKQDEKEKGPQSQKQQIVYQEPKTQPVQINPVIMAISKFFKIDTKQNYQQTMAKLRTQYKINSPLPSPKTQQPKKPVIKQKNSQFQQDMEEALKMRQLQKQQKRFQIKEKYFSKYAVPQVDVYSSFKGATIQLNSLNSLYGSAPKLVPNKQGKCSTVSECTFGAHTFDYDMRKKHSGEYKVNMASIIKDARNQIMDKGKENKSTNQVKKLLNKQVLTKSRLNSISDSQNFPNPTLGYKKLHDLKHFKDQEETLSSILLKNSQIKDGEHTSRSQKIKHKSKDVNSPLLHRMGCHQEDDLLNKYFDQQKHSEKSNFKFAAPFR